MLWDHREGLTLPKDKRNQLRDPKDCNRPPIRTYWMFITRCFWSVSSCAVHRVNTVNVILDKYNLKANLSCMCIYGVRGLGEGKYLRRLFGTDSIYMDPT